MKKILLPILTTLFILTSCQKDDDLLTPVTPPPNTNLILDSNQTNNTTDTNQVINTSDTINSNVFIGEGKSYKVILTEFEIVCSELTNIHWDTSYSYTNENIGTAGFFDGIGVLSITAYPQISNGGSPAHSYAFRDDFMMDMYITNYTYSDGVLWMDIFWDNPCPTQSDLTFSTNMVVTNHTDKTISLTLDQEGSNAGVSWSSHLYLLLEEDI